MDDGGLPCTREGELPKSTSRKSNVGKDVICDFRSSHLGDSKDAHDPAPELDRLVSDLALATPTTTPVPVTTPRPPTPSQRRPLQTAG
jgi:hypothetical protein